MIRLFFLILSAVGVLLGVYTFFYIKRMLAFYGMNRKKLLFKLFLPLLLAVLTVYGCMNMRNVSSIIILHIFVTAVVLDLAAFIGRLIFRKSRGRKFYAIGRTLYRSGLIPFILSGVVLLYGTINMKNIVRTDYLVSTEKNVRNYTVALITDTHYGTIQDAELLKNTIEKINAEHPDIVLLGGDIVEEGTSKEKMEEAFQVLGTLKSAYGVYYVYGNHDRQPYTEHPAYTREELKNSIEENGIQILQDSLVEINDDLILAGREDAGNSPRASVDEILKDVDRDKYIILADHQPIETEKNASLGVDLELCGHTHAGQLWPIGIFTELFLQPNYGEYHYGSSTLIVSSGHTGWGYPVRTQKHCEYVMLLIENAH